MVSHRSGNRFFISLTPLFIIGLAAFLDFSMKHWGDVRSAFAVAGSIVGLLILWNGAFVFQWGTSMIATRGPISWGEMIHNQYAVVPQRIAGQLESYLLERRTMMQRIEGQDVQRLQSKPE